MNPAEWLVRSAALDGAAPALMRGTDVLADYASLAGAASRLAGGLAARGIGPGDRVALWMSNAPEYLVALFGIWWVGAAAVPVNAKLHPAEAGWIIRHSGAALVFADDPEAAFGVPLIVPDGADWQQLISATALPAPAQMEAAALCWLFYTSGTTGRPKGVCLTAGNLGAMVMAYLADVDPVSASDHALYAAPLSHGAGLYALVHVVRGARHVVPRSGGFDPAEILDLAGRLGRIHMFAAPTMVRRLADHARAVGATGAGLRTIVYGGGPMYLADLIAAVDVFGPVLVQIYGQGESPMTITTLDRATVADRSHPDWQGRAGSVGRAFGCTEVRVVDAEGKPLAPGEIGEICVKGPQVMAGYWNDPDATARTIRDGWLWTGDMGALDAAGFLTLHDRSKDLIISGGSNIYPREVEEALLTHPDVAEVAVVGRSDPDWGEAVVAFVVARRPVSGADLMAHLDTRIARFKRPKDWHFVDDLPKNNYGKVLKTDLRSLLARDKGD